MIDGFLLKMFVCLSVLVSNPKLKAKSSHLQHISRPRRSEISPSGHLTAVASVPRGPAILFQLRKVAWHGVYVCVSWWPGALNARTMLKYAYVAPRTARCRVKLFKLIRDEIETNGGGVRFQDYGER